jgi:hypothetical protein
MMLPAGFNEHAITIPKKRESSGTDELYIVRLASG